MLGQTQRGPGSMRASGADARARGAVDQTRAYFVGAAAPETTRVCTPPPADLADDDVDAGEVTQVDAVMPRECAFDATWLAMIAAAQRSSRTAAELVWDSLEGEDQTAVWSPEGPSDATVADFAPVDDRRAMWTDDAPPAEDVAAEHDTAQHAVVPLRWVEARTIAPEPVVCTTSRMPPARAALLLRLAPTGYAGCGTPVDAAVVPRGRVLDVGRACAGPWAGDPYLDALHVRLIADADGVRVIDDGSRGGVWMRLEGAHWLRDGDAFRIGEQFFAYDGPDADAPAQLQMIDQEHRFGPAIAIDGVTVMGRAASHVVLMHDPYVSGEHCRIVPGAEGVVLEDLASSNGTWVRMRSGDLIPFGGIVAIGRSVYRVAAAEGQ